MPLSPGFRLGPYEIVAPIGAGGMGEVYRARDTRLGREVAVKVLPQHFSGDPGRRERFEREARVISNLNHPHICTLFDIGTQETPEGQVEFLVMEHIEGETLASRLAKGALPMEQVLRTATEIADALDRAHRQGVIHRDLKPANVMLTRSGAKLLDFGLAKLTEGRGARGAGSGSGGGPGGAAPGAGAAGGASDRAFGEGSLLATATRDLTTAGSLLGTFQYMAPEQLEGREADARTDIFAFGVLVYEMATGHKAFEGKSQASLIAAVLKEQPRPITEWQPLSPPGLERVVRACMEKDPDERVQTAHDVKRQLGWVADGSLSGVVSRPGVSQPGGVPQPGGGSQPGGGPSPVTAASRRGPASWLVVPAFVLFGAATAALGWWLHAAPKPPVLRVNLQLPGKTQLDNQNASLALAPDGRTLAYSGTGTDGKFHIWIRALDSLQAEMIAGTDGGTYPFWSPDGKFLGFFADEKLKKVPATGGTVQTLCEAQDGRGATWGADGQIVFAPVPYGGLQIVSAAGGTPAALTTTKEEGATHRLPHFLPDGKRILFFASEPGDNASNGIQVLDVASRKFQLLAPEKSDGRYVAPGYLIFVREGNLMARPIDAKTLKFTGDATPIAEKVQFNPNRWTGAFTFADTGLAVYQTGTGVPRSRFTWFDSEGKEQGAIGEPASIVEMSLAPDGKRAAATVLATGSATASIWIFDLTRGVGSRLTFNADGGSSPVWSPDGRQVAYTDSQNRVFVKAVDGASEPRALIPEPGVNRALNQWTPDGSGILLTAQNPKTGFDLIFLPVAAGEKPRPVFATAANEGGGRVSPDGHWLTYDSDESGRREQYITAWPIPGGKWQVSPTGGFGGGWTEGGKRILYGDPDGKVMSVEVSFQGGSVTTGAPHAIFGGRVPAGALDVTQDGKRFLVTQPIEEAGQSSLVLMTDWTAALPK